MKTLDGRITDPETRITDDVDTFATSVTQLQHDLFVPVLKILVFGANVAVNFGITGSLQFDKTKKKTIFYKIYNYKSQK